MTLMASTVFVSTEFRFQRTPDGRVWTDISNDHDHWVDRFSAFDRVVMVARTRDVPVQPTGASELTGPRLSVLGLPEYRTPLQFVRSLPKVARILSDPAMTTSTVIAELPGAAAILLLLATVARRRKFAVTVVGDPDAVFSEARVGGTFRAVYRLVFATSVRLACRHAVGAAYVADYLEQKYPPAPSAIVARWVSFIQIDDTPLLIDPTHSTVRRIVTVGSLEQPYKGIEDLLQAVSLLTARGHRIHLRIIGDGRLRTMLERNAASLGIGDATTFTGWVPYEVVKREMRQADLFVLASHTEGMPRALLEAMAQGVACVATRVGGIPEVLPEAALVDPRNSGHLAERIDTFLSDDGLRNTMAQRNLERVAVYRPESQRRKLTQFYRAVEAAVDAKSA